MRKATGIVMGEFNQGQWQFENNFSLDTMATRYFSIPYNTRGQLYIFGGGLGQQSSYGTDTIGLSARAYFYPEDWKPSWHTQNY
jgi:hypothetical protein